MIDQRDWDRLARFAAGECSAEEAEATARWVEEMPERREALAFVRDLGVAAETGRPQWDTDVSWDRLVARQRMRTRPPLRLTPMLVRGTERRWWLAAAAAVAVIAGASIGAWRLRHATAPDPLAANGPLLPGIQEHATAQGERATFQLPDGTPVVLAAASRLRYPSSFNASTGRREVYLDGKALFLVKHDERRPFIVRTTHGITEDLGTRFAVQEYSGDTAVEVVVAEGSVELRKRARAGDGALLRPGQLGQLMRDGNAFVRSGVDVRRHLAWTEGRLEFEDTPLRDALRELGRWYDLDFVLGDSTLGARHLTTVLSGEAITETLKLLSSTLDLDYEQHGRTVTFVPRHSR